MNKNKLRTGLPQANAQLIPYSTNDRLQQIIDHDSHGPAHAVGDQIRELEGPDIQNQLRGLNEQDPNQENREFGV